MKWIYLLLCLPLLGACSVSERENIVNLTREWTGKEVLFPKEYVLNVYWEDSVIRYNKIEFQQIAILTYIDSVGCMSCKMDLPEWTEFIWELDSISNRTLPCLFILNPKNDDKKRIADLLRRTGFSYPVCVDERDSFNLLNKFPEDERFRTFLLNNENKVIAIGNPIHNPKVKELYLNIIQGKDVNSRDDNKVLETFEISLSPVCEDDILLGMPNKLALSGDIMAISDTKMDSLVHFVNVRDGKYIGKGCAYGQGPDEMSMITSLSPTGEHGYTVYESNRRTLYRMYPDGAGGRIETLFHNRRDSVYIHREVHPLTDGNYVATGLNEVFSTGKASEKIGCYRNII